MGTKSDSHLPQKRNWNLYLLSNAKTSNTYLGVTTDPSRRLRQHNGEISGGARATRNFGKHWRIRLVVPFLTKSEALSIERTCKNKRRKGKGKTPLERRINIIHTIVEQNRCLTFSHPLSPI